MTKLAPEDKQLIQTLITERNLQQGAYRRFQSPIKKYLEFHNNKKTMTQLIREARKEQEQGKNPQQTKLYQYLTDFRMYLNDIVSPSTLKNYMIQLKEVYRHNDIIIPVLKPFKLREPPQVTYHDLPSKQDIRNALQICTTGMRALILFQSSSGTTIHESLTITIGMFFEACHEYLDDTSNESVSFTLSKLLAHDCIVPIFHLERVKTNKYYYTCCSPEATKEIIKYLQIRLDQDEELTLDSKIFPHYKTTYTKRYWMLNQKLGLGFVGKYSKFRSHALRKFHASNIGCSVELIDELQGRGKNVIHEAYIKDRPQKIKEEYMKYMNNVMINPVFERGDEDGVEQTVNIEVDDNQQIIPIQQMVDTNVYKEIGKLELRIELLEKQLQQLTQKEGGLSN